jgi:hypothetical protein
MSWFHKHELELVSKTYAPPAGIRSVEGGYDIAALPALEKMMHGCTTFVWKCKDPECDKIVVQECLGKEIEQ